MRLINWKTHRILKCLYEHDYSQKQKSKSGGQYSTTMSIIDIQRSTNYRVNDIDKVCNNLVSLKYLASVNEDLDFKNHTYQITQDGCVAYLEKNYLHQIGQFYRPWFAIVISIFAILVSVCTFVSSYSNNIKVERIEEELQSIKEVQDSVQHELRLIKESVPKE